MCNTATDVTCSQFDVQLTQAERERKSEKELTYVRDQTRDL